MTRAIPQRSKRSKPRVMLANATKTMTRCHSRERGNPRRPRGPSCWPGRLHPVRRRSRTAGKSARLRGVLDSRVRGNDMNAPLGGGVRPFPKLQPMIVAPRLDTRVRGYDKREN